MRAWIVAGVIAALMAGCAGRRVASDARSGEGEVRGEAYSLSTCAWCDRALGYVGPAEDAVIGGRSLRFCTASCAAQFRNDARRGSAHVDAVIARDQRPLYPIGVSIVSGRSLGAGAVDVVWGNRLVRLAEESERRELLGAPERYVALLDREVLRAQEPGYGMPTRCPVQGDILGSDTVHDIVVAGRMVRVCCGRCVRVVRARPYQYLAMVDYANRESAREREEASKAGEASAR